VISDRLLALVRCPDCRGALSGPATALVCGGCGRRFPPAVEYLDLRPRTAFAETTRYADEALHADGRHERVSPPLLSAGVRYAMLRRWLRPGRRDAILDLGCGSGRALVWLGDTGAYRVGVDVSPYFAAEARASVDLIVGDLRQLPLPDGAFTKAFALDVWEHFSREALVQVLQETARVLAPGGQLFVYSHVRENSRLAALPRGVNRLARRLERVGLVDLSHERLRKADHRNPIANHRELRGLVADAGFRLAAIRYYTPVVGAFVENILVRLAERAFAGIGRPARSRGPGVAVGEAEHAADRARLARARATARLGRRGLLYWALAGMTWLMRLDLVLFGRVVSGPFFALLVKEAGGAEAEPCR
jgi:SAM-dependent methyltransferase